METMAGSDGAKWAARERGHSLSIADRGQTLEWACVRQTPSIHHLPRAIPLDVHEAGVLRNLGGVGQLAIVIPTRGDDDLVILDAVYQPVLIVDPSRPESLVLMFERFGLANTREGAALNVRYKFEYPPQQFGFMLHPVAHIVQGVSLQPHRPHFQAGRNSSGLNAVSPSPFRMFSMDSISRAWFTGSAMR